MSALRSMPLDRSARRFRATLLPAMALSLALHGVLLVAWRSGTVEGGGRTVESAPSPDPVVVSEERALEVVRLAPVAPAIVVPPPPATAQVRPVRPQAPALPVASGPAAGTLHPVAFARPPGPPARAAGTGAGRGRGDGDDRVSPPVPLSVLPVWEPPEAIRGREFRVRVHVGEDGRPTGPVELLPRSGDEAFDRLLLEKVRAMRFRPARTLDGRPVAAWAELVFGF